MESNNAVKAMLFWIPVALYCALLIFLLTTTKFPPPGCYPSGLYEIIVKTSFKLMHIPLFASLTFLLVVAINAQTNFVRCRLLKYYFGIFGVSIFFAALTEALQFIGPRNASLFDLLLDGRGGFLLLRVNYLRSLRRV